MNRRLLSLIPFIGFHYGNSKFQSLYVWYLWLPKPARFLAMPLDYQDNFPYPDTVARRTRDSRKEIDRSLQSLWFGTVDTVSFLGE